MRINKFVAAATGISRRKADDLVASGRVTVGGQAVAIGHEVTTGQQVQLDGRTLTLPEPVTIILNKPVGCVVSRDGQGSKTVYDLLPKQYQQLKPIGRLDKDSSGLLLLTNDGALANDLTHPSRNKTKAYQITLDRPLEPLHRQMISDIGVQLDDGPSKFELERQREGNDAAWTIRMHEGRNRQIRRTFAALGYTVTKLHRTHFDAHNLGDLEIGEIRPLR